MAAKRKNISEFAINMATSMSALIQQDSLEDPDYLQMLSPFSFHIYMVARRPRIAVIPESFKADEKYISLAFSIQKENSFKRVERRVPNEVGTDIQLRSSYPYTQLEIIDSNGDILFPAKSANLFAKMSPTYSTDLDLDVLYVGQSYGNDGSRVAVDRLKSHSTLQSIYSQAIAKSPDHEVWLILWEFKEMLIMSFDGKAVDYQARKSEDDAHTEKILSQGITDQQKINFTEAALIRYFKPPYNKKFKNSFPSPAHSTYSECYDIDLSAISVELQSEQLFSKLGSVQKPSSYFHFIKFDLYSKSKRKSMFDF